MNHFTCETCEDTGYVTVANGPEDFEKIACPDCDLGLEILEKEGLDMSGAGEEKER